MVTFTLTLLLLLLISLGYIGWRWNFNYWRNRGVPGPKPSLLTGNYPSMYTMKQHMVYDLQAVYRQYKNKYDAVGIFSSRCPQLLIVNPELARGVFVTHFKHFHDNELSHMTDEKTDFIFANNPFTLTGEKWKNRRADVTPGLTQSRIKAVYPVTNEVCQKMSDWLVKQIRLAPKEGIDAKDMCLRFTSEMVTDCVLGLKADSFTDRPTPILANIKDLFSQSISFVISFLFFSMFPSLLSVFKMRFVPKRIELFFVDLMQNAVNSRRNQMSSSKRFERKDFLDYMLQLAEKRNLDTRQLTAYSMTFLLDGFETTASVLSHLLLFLGRDAKVQQKLRDEVSSNLNADGFIEFDKLNELPYLDACIQECIRIFPPGFLSTKLCTESLELSNRQGQNFTVERGTIVVVPHYLFMMDEENFPNPQEYQPERFLQPDAAKTYRERGVCMGFGDGPRICIGMRFSMAQIKAAAVEIITKFNICVNPKTRTDNLLDPLLFVSCLQGGVHLDFEPRQ